MPEGEIAAVFKALAKDAAETARNVSESVAKLTAKTADTEEANLAAILETDARAADNITAAGKKGGPESLPGARPIPPGPPWPVADGVPGHARGKKLNPPNPRHTVAGARSGEVKAKNTVILRGNEQAVREDIAQIAAGNARWDDVSQHYIVNGRSYFVESTGTVFPVSGPGLAPLDRNEYAALSELAKAGGKVSEVRAFTSNPRFVDNPEAIAKAKAIYDGTYSG